VGTNPTTKKKNPSEKPNPIPNSAKIIVPNKKTTSSNNFIKTSK
jgi:hypothetical protein